MHELERAWSWREKRGFLGDGAVRIFHGPGDGSRELRDVAIDRYCVSAVGAAVGQHYWITVWREGFKAATVEKFLLSRGASSAVVQKRSKKKQENKPEVLFGSPPEDKFVCEEHGLKFIIKFNGTSHPGLFLDHAPLRLWLAGRSKGLSVLNTFSYTGSLSVAAASGGAAHVTSIDLSKPYTEWAKANWELNGLESSKTEFVCGDVFEWLSRHGKRDRKFDCVILDPPSFSRSAKGSFSVESGLGELHGLAFDVLADGGFIITSINSASVSWDKYEREILSQARKRDMRFEILRTIDLPETFPTRLGDAKERYLKGWILRRRETFIKGARPSPYPPATGT